MIEPVERNFRPVLLTTNSSVTKTDRAFNGAPALLNSLTLDFLVCVTEWLLLQTHFDSKLHGILTRPISSSTYTPAAICDPRVHISM